MSSEKKIILKSSDGEVFEVEENVALESQTIKHMVEQGFADTVIPLPRVTSMILSKVIEYCKRLVEARAGDKKDDLNELKTMDLDELFDITKAANYLAIKSLLDVTLQIVADMLKGKTPEEIRKIFNIENDLTLEEESEFRRENQWAFE